MSTAGDELTITHLFVYGTLRPGDVRWPFLEPLVVDAGIDDSVDGTLYDTGLGYPAALFGDGNVVMGRTYILNELLLDEALDLLDVEEGSVDGLYHRMRLVTHRGVRAWAYSYGGGLILTPIVSGDWFDR